MIDEDVTFILFEYTSNMLKPHSHKKVLAVCNECGKERLVNYQLYRDLCISCARKGKTFSVEHKHKMSIAQLGNKNHMFGKTGKNNPGWKGGAKLMIAKRNTKRRELFGFIPHNLPQKNFHGHHLDFNHVIFIPKELHISVSHSVINNKNMEEINNIACDWYLKYQLNFS